MHPDTKTTRRGALALAGGLGATLAAGCARGGAGTQEASAAEVSCVLSPEVTEGPYWVENSLTRRNITEGRPGMPLVLDLITVDARTCEPIKGADVEIWHCDAGGTYSGVQGDTGHYLRGHQKADADGRARFVTVFPGWYRGRTPHIHIKVHVGGQVVHTGQLFFSEKVTAAVYRTSPYRSRGQADTSHAADNIFRQAGGSKAQAKLVRRTGGRKGYRGTLTMGVAT